MLSTICSAVKYSIEGQHSNACMCQMQFVVIRFSREDMLRLWRPSRILSVMTELPDIVSIPSLDPMSLKPLEQDEVSGFEPHHFLCA